MRRTETLASLGVDVGTTTTHAVVSRLRVETPPGGAASPEITEREIVHRGAIHETPLLDADTVDVDAVASLVEADLEAADIGTAGIETGAVIVTGETARRKNAEPLVHRLATDSGQFVAATAGAALEAVLAGRGSGSAALAAELDGTIANVDVGGGTTNVAIFAGGGFDSGDGTDEGSGASERPLETRCLDVGGRLVRIEDGTVVGVSPPARRLADAEGVPLEVDDVAEVAVLERLADAMAERIVDLLAGPPFDGLTLELAIGELPATPREYDGVVFTGGVGGLVNSASTPDGSTAFPYGDLGPQLAAALARHETVRSWPVCEPSADIRATVIGAGTESTTLSGRTISLEEGLLPLRNVPVVAVGSVVEASGSKLEAAFSAAVARALERVDVAETDAVAVSIDDVGELSYGRLRSIADALTAGLESVPPSLPTVVVARQNCAKALGQLLRERARADRPLVVLDELRVESGSYLDVGSPLAGRSVPVVVKTLAFGG